MDAQENREIDKRIKKKMKAIDKVAKTIKGVKAIPVKRLIVFIKVLAMCKELGINPHAPSRKRIGRQRS